VSGKVTVSSKVIVSGKVTVSGKVIVSSKVTVRGKVSMSDKVNLSGKVTLSGKVIVSGKVLNPCQAACKIIFTYRRWGEENYRRIKQVQKRGEVQIVKRSRAVAHRPCFLFSHDVNVDLRHLAVRPIIGYCARPMAIGE
jgi:hypothetical protein